MKHTTKDTDIPIIAISWDQSTTQIGLHLNMRQTKAMLLTIGYMYIPAIAFRVERFFSKEHLQQLWEDFVTWYDERHKETDNRCTHNIMCECQRRSCPGKTINIATYKRKISYD